MGQNLWKSASNIYALYVNSTELYMKNIIQKLEVLVLL